MKNNSKLNEFMKVNNDRRIYFTLTEPQFKIIQEHRDLKKLKSSKHMKMLVAWAFSNTERIKSFDNFIEQNKKSI
ncbi:hypothetical protein [Delftia tsuruhatensis]|uniref:hypothetical protein n=1 Tax=Delftia tsuruhatensis TaxID=180282 RepID=UPI0008DEE06E|nr:hypothetical protein [Delftia tsuruhatensis]SFB29135.1 hypothetical protein SAMN05444579_103585 [Delftia tsuruhatensis]